MMSPLMYYIINIQLNFLMVTDFLPGNQCFCRNKFFWVRFSWTHDIHRLLHAPKVMKKYKQFTWFRICWGTEEILWSMKATLYLLTSYDAMFLSYTLLTFLFSYLKRYILYNPFFYLILTLYNRKRPMKATYSQQTLT